VLTQYVLINHDRDEALLELGMPTLAALTWLQYRSADHLIGPAVTGGDHKFNQITQAVF
jgi:hypothetical protein